VSKEISLKRRFVNFLLDDLQKDLGGVKSEDGQHHLGHVEL
jgi:hypothetical protein